MNKSTISKIDETDKKFRVTAKNVIFFERPTLNRRLYRKESMPDILQQMKERNVPVYLRPLEENIFYEQPIGMMDKNSVVVDGYNISCDFVINDINVQELIKQDKINICPDFYAHVDQAIMTDGVSGFVRDPKLVSFSIEYID